MTKETTLYDREKDGVSVIATQTIEEVLVTEATEDKEAVYKNERQYLITATFNEEVVAEEEGASYRQTIQRARKVFKETYEQYAPKAVEAEADEEAAV